MTNTNIINGTSASETIVAADGQDDVIEGGAGHDTIFAYEGTGSSGIVGSGGVAPTVDPTTGVAGDADSVRGGDGNDTIHAGAGGLSLLYSGALSANDYDSFTNGSGWSVALAESDNTAVGLGGNYVNGVDAFDGNGLSGVTLQGDSGSRTMDFSATQLTDIVEIDGNAGHDTIVASDLSVASYRGGDGKDAMQAGSVDATFLYTGALSANDYDNFTNGAGWSVARAESDNTAIGLGGNYVNGVDAFDGNGLSGVTLQGDSGSRTMDFSVTQLTDIVEIDGNAGHDTIIASDLSVASYRGGDGNDAMQAGSVDATFLYTGALSANDHDSFTNGAGWSVALAESDNTAIGLGGNYVNGVDAFDGNGLSGVTLQGDSGSRTMDFSATHLTDIAEIDGNSGHDTIIASDLSVASYRGGDGNDAMQAGSVDATFLYTGALSANDYDNFTNGAGWSVARAESDNTAIGLGGNYVNGVDAFDGNGLSGVTLQGDSGSRTMDFSATHLIDIAEIDGNAGHDTIVASDLSVASYRGGDGKDAMQAGSVDATFLYTGALSANDYDSFNNGAGWSVALAESDNTAIGLGGNYVNGVDAFDGNGLSGVTLQGDSGSRTMDFSVTQLTDIVEIDGNAGHDTIIASDLSVASYRGGDGNDAMQAGSVDATFLYTGALSANDHDSFTNGAGWSVALAESDNTAIGLGGNYVNGVDAFDGNGLSGVTLQGDSGSRTMDFSATHLTDIAEIDGNSGHDTIIASDLSVASYRGGDGNDAMQAGSVDATFLYTGALSANDYDNFTNGAGWSVARAESDNTAIGLGGNYANGVDAFDGNGLSGVTLQGDSGSRTMDFSATQLTDIAEIDGNGGHDIVTTALSENVSVQLVYDGGSGNDHLKIALTTPQFLDPSVQAEIAAFQDHIDGAPPAAADPSIPFLFSTLGFTAVNFESAEIIIVNDDANNAPTLAAGVAGVVEDGPAVDVDLAALGDDVDSDDDGSTLTYTVTGTPSEGTASITGTTLTFDPGSDFQDLAVGETRDVTVQVTATDAHGATAVNDVTVTVTGTNDAPSIQSIINVQTNSEDDSFTGIATPIYFQINNRADDVDSDDDASSLTYNFSNFTNGDFVASAGGLQLNIAGNYDHLAVGETTQATATVTATDRHGAVSNESTLIWTITGTNDAPTGISISSNSVGENIPNIAVGTLSATDADSTDGHSFTLLSGADAALFTIVGDELRVGASGLDYETSPTRTVNVRATDPYGQSFDTTITVNVFDSEEITLTTALDTVVASASNVQVLGNANTLNGVDVLDGGAGFDSLVLYGTGTYDLNSVATYDGFEEVVMVNLTNTDVTLTLKDGSSTDVTLVTVGETFTNVNSTTSVGTLIGGDGSDRVDLHDTASAASIDLRDGSYEQLYLFDDSTATSVDFGSGIYHQAYLYNNSAVTTLDMGTGSNNFVYLLDNATAQNVQMGETGSNYFYAFSDQAWNNTLSIDGGTGYDQVNFSETNGTFDTTGVTLTDVEQFRFESDNVTVLVDQDTFADSDLNNIFSSRTGAAISTSEAMLDLSGISITAVSVESTNATGTIFDVSTASTGFLVKGGAGGSDTLRTDDFAFTALERDFIFGTSQIETIIDTSGSYSAPALAPDTFTLTTGTDAPPMTGANETVFGNSATLNATDSLDGGAGTDSLVLYGDGTFDLNSLAAYSNFEALEVVNIINTDVTLTLKDGSSTDVTLVTVGETFTNVNSTTSVGTLIGGDGSDRVDLHDTASAASIDLRDGSYEQLYLFDDSTATSVDFGSGIYHQAYLYNNSAVTTLDMGTGSNNFVYLLDNATAQNVQMGETGSNYFYAFSDQAWNNTLSIDGGTGYDQVNFSETNGTFDTTGVTLTDVEQFRFESDNVTVLVDQDTFADSDLNNIFSSRTGAAISTSEAMLDLSGISITAVSVESTNATGTIFDVSTASTGFLVKGGAGGSDTLRTDDFAFTALERDFIFGTSQIETIIDTSGSYSAPALAPDTFTLTTGTDAPPMTGANETVFGNSATLNATDSLDGGAGTDSLVLYGDGTFDLNSLAAYSNFEALEVVNIINTDVTLTLKDGSSTDVTLVTVGETFTNVNSTTSVGTLIGGDGSDRVDLHDTASAASIDLRDGSYEQLYLFDDSTATSVDFGSGIYHQAYLYNNSAVTTLDMGTGSNNFVYLLDNATAQNVQMGETGSNYFYAFSDQAWNNTLSIDGGTGYDQVNFSETNGTFDTTGVTLTDVEQFRFESDNVTVLVDQDTFADSDLNNIFSSRTGAAISTSEAMLDLSGISITAVSVESTNATGTIFDVSTASTGVQIVGGAGTDTVRTDDFAFSETEKDFLFNSGSIEIIADTSGIFGDVEANTLVALPGGSAMFGNGGHDTLISGSGDDSMTGGSGNDTFVMTLAGGNDTIHDYLGGAGLSDVLDVSAFGYASQADALAAGSDDGFGNTDFVLNDGTTFTLLGVNHASLNQDDFLI